MRNLVLSAFCLAAVASAAELPTWQGWSRWEPLKLPGVDTQTQYTQVQIDGRDAFRSESRCSASALAVPLAEMNLFETPRLRWEWKIGQGLDVHDERVKAGDDFAARVYVMFRFDPDRASWRERLQNKLGGLLYGRDVPGRALNYVWSSSEAAGESWDNPFAKASKMISMGFGPLPDWQSVEVDVLRDYRTLFGDEPPRPLGLAIMTDSDNTCSEAVAYFARFEFRSAAAVEGEIE